jgi:hypothetical protein
VLRLEVGAIPKRANRLGVGVWAGNCRMSNARVVFEIEAEGRANRWAVNKGERVAAQGGGGRENIRCVVDPDRNPRTLVVIIHEEAVNQFPGMAYFGGVFSRSEVSIRAMDYIPENQYPVQATIDVAGCWDLRGFCQFSIVQLLLTCLSQLFGH